MPFQRTPKNNTEIDWTFSWPWPPWPRLKTLVLIFSWKLTTGMIGLHGTLSERECMKHLATGGPSYLRLFVVGKSIFAPGQKVFLSLSTLISTIKTDFRFTWVTCLEELVSRVFSTMLSQSTPANFNFTIMAQTLKIRTFMVKAHLQSSRWIRLKKLGFQLPCL